MLAGSQILENPHRDLPRDASYSLIVPSVEGASRNDPVSWLLIKPGWKVVSSDGSEIGRVDEVSGDDTVDIFDGLAVAMSALGKPRYVAADQVARITQGTVVLTITSTEAQQLDEYLEPASSEQIEPDSKGGLGEEIGADVREIEGKAFAPTQRQEHSMNIWRRIWFWIRRGGR